MFEKSKRKSSVDIGTIRVKIESNPETKLSNSISTKTNENKVSAKNENSNPDANTKAKMSFISFKKPSTDSKYNAILEKIKSKSKIRSSTKKQKLLEEAAVKNKNSILNYVLPKTPKQLAKYTRTKLLYTRLKGIVSTKQN